MIAPFWIDAQFDGSNAAFALYDTHGNAKALLSRSGSSFTTADWRHYDVWGSVRSGLTSGGASHRYCANLGHVTDDESGLVYMRARFYEPWTGRFVSQDPAMDGDNWYVYCGNSPAYMVDPSGTKSEFKIFGTITMLAFLIGFCSCVVVDVLKSEFKWIGSPLRATFNGTIAAYIVDSLLRLESNVNKMAQQFENSVGKSGAYKAVVMMYFVHAVTVLTMLHLIGDALYDASPY